MTEDNTTQQNDDTEYRAPAHVHGGEGAVKAIQRGETLKGLAASEERAVKAELAASGRAEMVRQEAVRLKTACNLYWGAVCKAADDGDLEALDKYVKRYGWLAGATLRAWAQVKEEDRDRADVIEMAYAATEGGDDGNDG